MSSRQNEVFTISGNATERSAKILLVVLACFSCCAVLGLVWWKAQKENRKKQELAVKTQEKEAEQEHANRVIQTVTRFVTKERGFVVFSHGSLVTIPASSESPLDDATVTIKKVDGTEMKEIPVDSGSLVLEFSKDIQYVCFEEELKKHGKEESVNLARLNLKKDQLELKPAKILLPHITNEKSH